MTNQSVNLILVYHLQTSKKDIVIGFVDKFSEEIKAGMTLNLDALSNDERVFDQLSHTKVSTDKIIMTYLRVKAGEGSHVSQVTKAS